MDRGKAMFQKKRLIVKVELEKLHIPLLVMGGASFGCHV
jgi:hypothetical protein